MCWDASYCQRLCPVFAHRQCQTNHQPLVGPMGSLPLLQASLYQKVPEKNPVASGSHFSVTLQPPPFRHATVRSSAPLAGERELSPQLATAAWCHTGSSRNLGSGGSLALLVLDLVVYTPKAPPSPCCPWGADAIPMMRLHNRTARPGLLPCEGP